MSWLANILARYLWMGMLWFVRRPLMRRMQKGSIAWLPPQRREKARISMIRQNRIARKYGFKVIRFTLTMLIASIIFTTTWFLILDMFESGIIKKPTNAQSTSSDQESP